MLLAHVNTSLSEVVWNEIPTVQCELEGTYVTIRGILKTRHHRTYLLMPASLPQQPMQIGW